MENSFASLGIPFPLFEGSTDEASEYAGIAVCSLCGKADQHCFDLGIGCAIMADCPSCGALNGLDADDRENISCHSCGIEILFPNLADEEIRVCYQCLSQGKAAMTKDTELGMISWEQAIEGTAHGGLVGAKLPTELMFELLRTPSYSSWQGERWQFCCKHPMVFVGSWSREEFSKRAPSGDGRAFFEQIVQDTVPGLWEDELHDTTGVYVFRCPRCDQFTAHWDIA